MPPALQQHHRDTARAVFAYVGYGVSTTTHGWPNCAELRTCVSRFLRALGVPSNFFLSFFQTCHCRPVYILYVAREYHGHFEFVCIRIELRLFERNSGKFVETRVCINSLCAAAQQTHFTLSRGSLSRIINVVVCGYN